MKFIQNLKFHSYYILELQMTQNQANSTIIASLMMEKYDNAKIIYTSNDIINDIQKNKKYFVELTYMQKRSEK